MKPAPTHPTARPDTSPSASPEARPDAPPPPHPVPGHAGGSAGVGGRCWSWLRCQPGRLTRPLRHSMTAQIGLAVMTISLLLVGGTTTMVMRLTRQELADIADSVLLGNLALLQRELGGATAPSAMVARDIVGFISAQVGGLEVAVVDGMDRRIAASPHFPLSSSLLPDATVPTDELPPYLSPEKVRALRQRWGSVSVDARVPGVGQYRVVVGRLWPRGARAGHPADEGWAVLALDTRLARDLAVDSAQVLLVALLLAAPVSLLAGWWVARRIVHAARRLGDTAARIGAGDLDGRIALHALPAELTVAGEAINAMLARLQASFTQLRQFSSDVAHDLRTPLNSMLGQVQVALSRPRSSGEYRVVLESVAEDCERLIRLTESLLFLARAEEHQLSVQPEWLTLDALASRAQDYFEPLAEERGLQLTLSRSPLDGGVLWADRLLLTRAVANLMANALAHARPGSVLQLQLVAGSDGSGRIAVANEGEPIPPELQPRVFERMFRADPARMAGGAGLGLAIVRSVMTLHGGSVTLRSAAGEPTVFTLHFPPAAAPSAAPATGASAA